MWASGILDQVNGYLGQGSKILGMFGQAAGPSFGQVDRNLVFPEDLSSDENKDRPALMLTTNDNREGLNNLCNIFLPIPMSLQMADSASYGNLELGPVGKMAMDAASSGANMSDAASTLRGFIDNLTNTQGRDAAAFLAPKLPKVFAPGVGHAFATQVNKNIHSSFGGVGTRGYSYSYKLVARTQSEANVIKKIHSVLRLGLYPESTNIVLRDPPIWNIRFVNLSTGKDLEHIPKVYLCYLTSVGTTFNGSANMWRVDNSPLEVDISMSFLEIKALSAGEILQLEKTGFKKEAFTNSALAYPSASTKKTTTPGVMQPSPGSTLLDLPEVGNVELDGSLLPPKNS